MINRVKYHRPAVLAAGLLFSSGLCADSTKPEGTFFVKTGYWSYFSLSEVSYQTETPSPAKEKINDRPVGGYSGLLFFDPTYAGKTTVQLHTQWHLEDPLFDDDHIDEASINIKNKHFGLFYLGEDDGAADRLKPDQAGKVSVAVGQGAYGGVIPWWGNLPYKGGSNRDERFEWKDGIVSGDWKGFSRDSVDTLKMGYETPKIHGLTFGFSVNLQDSYAGFQGPGSAPRKQDDWDNLEIKDEYESGVKWQSSLSDNIQLSSSLTYMSLKIVKEDVRQNSIDFGSKLSIDSSSGIQFGSSVLYSQQTYVPENRAEDTDEQVHLGLDAAKGKWTLGLNYTRSWNHWNAPFTRLRGGGRNTGYSFGADYIISKGIKLGSGVIRAKNLAGEEATEFTLTLTLKQFKKLKF